VIMKRSLERIGIVLVWTMAGMGMVTAISGYLLPAEVHAAIAKPFYGAYTTEQFPVLDSHYAISFFHRFGGFLFMALVPLQLMRGFVRATSLSIVGPAASLLPSA
jgi:hypothetical protein